MVDICVLPKNRNVQLVLYVLCVHFIVIVFRPMKNSIPIREPERGHKLLLALNERTNQHYILTKLIPFTADVFVFTYPVYLVGLYLWGINKRSTYYKEAALTIFFSSMSAAIVNVVIQFFGDKARPEQAIVNKNFLLLDHLPSDPFPSDHAAVSAAIAMSTLLRGMKHKDPFFVGISVFFWIACGLMSFSRVAVAVHRPTDVLVGIVVGVLVAWMLLSKKIFKRLQKWLFPPLISAEKWLFKHFFGIQQ